MQSLFFVTLNDFFLLSMFQPANTHLRLFAPEDVPAVHKLLNDHLDAT